MRPPNLANGTLFPRDSSPTIDSSLMEVDFGPLDYRSQRAGSQSCRDKLPNACERLLKFAVPSINGRRICSSDIQGFAACQSLKFRPLTA